MSWAQVNLGELMSIKHGWAFKGEYFTQTGDQIVLTPGNFKERGGLKIRPGKEKFYSGDYPSEYLLTEGDLLVVMTDLKQTAPILGGALFVPQNNRFLHNQRLGLVSVDEKKSCPKYIYYVMNWEHVRGQIRATATGATVRHTAPKRIYDIQIEIPVLPIQTRIADILSAYDDLIENNNRRMALLEEAIHLLYREWFVYLRFPGHERVEVVDGVPEGWERTTLGEVTSLISRGVSPKYNEESAERAVNQRCIRDRRINLTLAREHEAKVPDAKRLRQWDVLVNSTGVGTLGRVAQVWFVPESLTVDTHVTIIRPNEEQNTLWFGAAMESLESHFENIGHGATGQIELRRTLLAELSILSPAKELQQRFARTIEEMRQICLSLANQNQRLREARDLLVPRLMDGRIAI